MPYQHRFMSSTRTSLLPQVKNTGLGPHQLKNRRATVRKLSARRRVSMLRGSIFRTRWWSFLWIAGRT